MRPRTGTAAARRPARVVARPAFCVSVLVLLAAACGSGEVETVAAAFTPVEPAAPEPEPPPLWSRPIQGIVATGARFEGGEPCRSGAGETGAGAEMVRVAWVSPDKTELRSLGLESLVLDDPVLGAKAYVNELNMQGGVGGRCVELLEYVWSYTNTASDQTRICKDLQQQQPAVVVGFYFQSTMVQCVTVTAGIPTVAIGSVLPAWAFSAARGRLFADLGSSAHLASNSLAGAMASGWLSDSAVVGLLYPQGSGGATDSKATRDLSERLGLQYAIEEAVSEKRLPPAMLAAEREVGILAGGDESSLGAQLLRELPEPVAATLMEVHGQFMDIARRFQAAGVTVLVTTADWTDVRRLMLAADEIGWHPAWVTTDIQPSSLMLNGAPSQQSRNVLQASTARAPGDPIVRMDAQCVHMRNSAVEAQPFGYGVHTDAWNMLASICEYLDVVFGSIAKIDDPLTADAVAESLRATSYDSERGTSISFSPENVFGSQKFRVLMADPECLLNSWGCMRAVSDWMPVQVATAGVPLAERGSPYVSVPRVEEG